ncbi:CHRD domain-containing protein [Ammoniphilus sp. 3BR4]|uniref:CHRD domain-containing protein n=1 Tax=Ammoniphilus sp. 3BR4 TaxID=3158265 RepID=UPI0034663755
MRTFVARLRGSEEVPPVVTNATGMTHFRLSEDGSRLHFTLVVDNIRKATEAHIHLGRRGENGDVVAFLFGPVRRGVSARRGVVRGIIRAADLVGPLAGHSLSTLLHEMSIGNTYVNVHTVQNPEGEVRGQIRHGRRRKHGGGHVCG